MDPTDSPKNPQPVAFRVRTGKRHLEFRRCGRVFTREPVDVPADSLTDAQREFLVASAPADLVVEPLFAEPPAAPAKKGK